MVQLRYALFLLLREVRERPECELSIERLDDVAFERNGAPLELIQLKHGLLLKQASLTDASEELWKTLRIWSIKLREAPGDFPNLLLTLVTTGQASDGSAAALLRQDRGRDHSHTPKS